jgi:hypothetical protein
MTDEEVLRTKIERICIEERQNLQKTEERYED